MLSRGNRRATVFDSPNEFVDFIALLDEVRRHYDVDLLAFCLMPNHFHLVAQFEDANELSGLLQLWLTTHVRRHHLRHATTGLGHVWQDRFKSFPIQADHHLLTVCRYVLLNPCRAKLVRSPWEWRWSSLWFDAMLAPWPVAPPLPMREWLTDDGAEHDDSSDEDVRTSIRRGRPYGDPIWTVDAAQRMGLETTLNPRGRPKLNLAETGVLFPELP